MDDLTDELLRRVRDVVGDEERIGLHEPTLTGNAEAYVRDTVTSGWVSSVGAYVDRFENVLGEITGAHAVATVNGTSALQIALRLAGVEVNDEVIMPSLTFVASANAVSHAGAVPHFCDVDAEQLNMSVESLAERLATAFRTAPAGGLVNRRTGRRLGAILVVHVFGNPAATGAIKRLADAHDVPVVEDAAEALGAWDEREHHCGTVGQLGVLSFNGNKIVTTGGGGAILTADEQLARRAKHLTTTAKLSHPWEFSHDEVAWNHRMPNLNAALGCAQLEMLDSLLDRKARLVKAYASKIGDMPGVRIITSRPETRPNNWLIGVRFEHPAHQRRFLERSNASGIGTRPIWTPMHRLPMYAGCERGDLTNTDQAASRVVNLPSSAHLVDEGSSSAAVGQPDQG
jgi:perosamine synthetase